MIIFSLKLYPEKIREFMLRLTSVRTSFNIFSGPVESLEQILAFWPVNETYEAESEWRGAPSSSSSSPICIIKSTTSSITHLRKSSVWHPLKQILEKIEPSNQSPKISDRNLPEKQKKLLPLSSHYRTLTFHGVPNITTSHM